MSGLNTVDYVAVVAVVVVDDGAVEMVAVAVAVVVEVAND